MRSRRVGVAEVGAGVEAGDGVSIGGVSLSGHTSLTVASRRLVTSTATRTTRDVTRCHADHPPPRTPPLTRASAPRPRVPSRLVPDSPLRFLRSRTSFLFSCHSLSHVLHK